MDSITTTSQEPESGSFWSAWASFSDSVSEGLNEISVALAQTGTSISESLTQAWEGFEWEELEEPTDSVDEDKQSHLQILEKAAENWDAKVRQVWNAKLEECSIHIDIPRLISKIRVQDADGQVLFSAQENQEAEDQVLAFFAFLSKTLDDQIFQKMIDNLTKSMSDSPVFTNALKAMLEFPDAHQSPAVKLLKGMHQRILFPAYYYIKYLLRFSQMKDKSGAWRIVVTLTKDQIIVQHKKAQVILEWMLKDSSSNTSDALVIEAEWELNLVFDAKTMELTSLTTNITDGYYNPQAIDPELAEYYNTKALLKPQSPQQNTH